MDDLLGFSGAAKEIVNAISAGIGTLYRPRGVRAEADAQAYALAVRTHAEAQAALLTRATGGDAVAIRAVEKLRKQIVSRQNNLESIFDQAITLANSVKGANDSFQTIDPDWIAKLLNHAEDVSQSEVQHIWASILAKQATTGDGVSLKTLDILRNISRNDALAFTAFLRIQKVFGGRFYPVDSDCMQRNGIHVIELRRLVDLGLLKEPKTEWNQIDNQLQQCYPFLTCILQSVSPHTTEVAGHLVSIYGNRSVDIYAYVLTTAGNELGEAICGLDEAAVAADDLFQSFCETVGLRQGYTIKQDGDVTDEERAGFYQSRDSGEEFDLARSAEFEIWKKRYRAMPAPQI